MKKQNKKPNKEVEVTIIKALLDLTIAIIVLIIEKLLN